MSWSSTFETFITQEMLYNVNSALYSFGEHQVKSANISNILCMMKQYMLMYIRPLLQVQVTSLFFSWDYLSNFLLQCFLVLLSTIQGPRRHTIKFMMKRPPKAVPAREATFWLQIGYVSTKLFFSKGRLFQQLLL